MVSYGREYTTMGGLRRFANGTEQIFLVHYTGLIAEEQG